MAAETTSRTTILLLLVFTTCCTAPKQKEEIRIGLYAPLSGSTASFGSQVKKGVELAVDERNAAGGIDGTKIALFTEDDRGEAGEAQNAVTKLITRDRVSAIIGEATSSGSLAAAPVSQHYRIPMITPTATNPRVTQIGDCIFRVCWLDTFQGEVIAKFAATRLNLKRVAVLYDISSDYSVGLMEVFSQSFSRQGGTMLQRKSYAAGDTDFSAQLTAIKADQPDGIYIPGYYSEVGLIARQVRKLGIEAILLGTDGWDAPELFEVGSGSLDGSYYVTHFYPGDPAPAVQSFVKKFQDRYRELPALGSALGYDATRLMFEAIEKVGISEPSRICEVLAQTSGFQGVTGSITMNADRNPIKPAVILGITKDKAQFVERSGG